MTSDIPIKIAFRNFRRNKMVNLSAKSIKHFLPNSEIHCFTFFKESEEEYSCYEKFLPYINNHYIKTKYINVKQNNDVYDHVDPTKTSGYGNLDNGYYFVEGYNFIFDFFKNCNEKIVMLSEDHFFTKGKVLKEIIDNEYDIAISPWIKPHDANAGLLVMNPNKVNHLFPLPEINTMLVEDIIGDYLVTKLPENKIYRIKNRKWIDYCEDGLYTNSSEIIYQELKKVGIV